MLANTSNLSLSCCWYFGPPNFMKELIDCTRTLLDFSVLIFWNTHMNGYYDNHQWSTFDSQEKSGQWPLLQSLRSWARSRGLWSTSQSAREMQWSKTTFPLISLRFGGKWLKNWAMKKTWLSCLGYKRDCTTQLFDRDYTKPVWGGSLQIKRTNGK